MKTIFTSLLLFVVLFSVGQNTFKTKIAVANRETYYFQTIQLSNGNFISAGFIGGGDDSDANILISQYAPNGTLISSKEIDSKGEDEAYAIIKTSDGGFAISGYIDEGAVLMKFKSDFTIEWTRKYTVANGNVHNYSLIQTSDNGYMIVGDITYGSYDDRSGYVIKTDSQGNVLFSKRYLDFNNKYIISITITSDGNFALLATSDYDDSRLDSTYIIKIKTNGDIIWSTHIYNDTNLKIFPYSITGSSDGGILIGGAARTDDSLNEDQFMMMKLNGNGSMAWSRTIATTGESDSYSYSIIEDSDKGYLFTGYLDFYTSTDSSEDFTDYIMVAKTNSSGILQWTKNFEPKVNEISDAFGLMRATDGGYVICGTVDDDEYDLASFIYKFNNSFEICGESPISNGTTRDFGTVKNETVETDNISVTMSSVTTTFTSNGIPFYTCSILPLQLLSFNATLQNKAVNINWTTANEVNTSYFTVERSKDAIAFTALQQVTAKGNSAGVQSYNTADLQPLPGTSYYRLKEVDKDGKITYSSVVKVTILNNGTIVISPNPVQNTIRVVMQSATNANTTFQVVDMKGSVLATQKTSVTTGRNEILIPAVSLAKGVYMLKVVGNNTTQTIRFVKE